jgi:hypothetical protein
MIITLKAPLAGAAIVRRLRPQLPPGLSILTCEAFRPLKDVTTEAAYRVQLMGATFPEQPLEALGRQSHFYFERSNRKGRLKKIDLKAMLKSIQRVQPDMLEFTLHHQLEALVRPADLLTHLFKLDPGVIRRARVTKLKLQHHPRQVGALR